VDRGQHVRRKFALGSLEVDQHREGVDLHVCGPDRPRGECVEEGVAAQAVEAAHDQHIDLVERVDHPVEAGPVGVVALAPAVVEDLDQLPALVVRDLPDPLLVGVEVPAIDSLRTPRLPPERAWLVIGYQA
jgi:hypothetical protein